MGSMTPGIGPAREKRESQAAAPRGADRLPIMAGDQMIGAVGISGTASAKQDEEIAILAAAAVEPASQQKMRPDRRVLPKSCIVMLHHPLHAVAEIRRVITPIRPKLILR